MCNSPNQKSLLVKTFYDTLLIGKRRQTFFFNFFFSSIVVSIHVERLSTTNTQQCCIKNNQNLNFPANVKEKKENSYLPRRQDNNQNLKTRIVRMQVDAQPMSRDQGSVQQTLTLVAGGWAMEALVGDDIAQDPCKVMR